MRRLLVPVALLLLGGMALALARRLAAARPAGTPGSWPTVPRRPVAGPA